MNVCPLNPEKSFPQNGKTHGLPLTTEGGGGLDLELHTHTHTRARARTHAHTHNDGETMIILGILATGFNGLTIRGPWRWRTILILLLALVSCNMVRLPHKHHIKKAWKVEWMYIWETIFRLTPLTPGNEPCNVVQEGAKFLPFRLQVHISVLCAEIGKCRSATWDPEGCTCWEEACTPHRLQHCSVHTLAAPLQAT
jgi:hypothetical protein